MSRYRAGSLLSPIAGAVLAAAAAGQERLEPPAPPPGVQEWRVGRVRLETGDVFSEAEAAANLLYRAANMLHVRTREEVIAREAAALLAEGDPYRPAAAAELERNLRRIGFLAEATVEPRFLPDGTVDLLVHTRDRFTLRAGVGGSSFAGQARSRASLGEENLFGRGKEASIVYARTPDVTGAELRYVDPQLLGTRHRLEAAFSHTDEGTSGEVSLLRPFDTLATPWSYGVRAGHLEDEAEFFEAGEDVAKVPRKVDVQDAFLTRGFGPREKRRLFGVRLLHERTDFGTPEGPAGPSLRVPGDLDSWRFGPTAAWQDYPRFLARTYLDSLGFVEDVPTGTFLETWPGVRYRSEERSGARLEAAADADFRWVDEPWPEGISVLRLSASGRYGEGEGRAWGAGAFLHLYETRLPLQTLAANLAADFIWEGGDLPEELRLGEESGLRGYKARALTGTKRVHLNVEDRLALPLEVLTVRAGLVAFFDAGEVWDRGEPFEWSEAKRSVGIGLRLGSLPFLGRRVVRIDVAFPLDEVAGTTRRMTVTFASGQVFTLFENPEGLSKEF
ncbi:MAG TPA: BamA/TamA family outer membrane protein [Planctomycetota bacterium]|nr:BamA/TamA family outer membrane protein [Planctomycetota bacterium]